MKVTFEEIRSKKSWLQRELLGSLTGELISKAAEDGFYDIQLSVNGVLIEPALFNKIMDNIEHYIDSEAKFLVAEKLDEAGQKANDLNNLIQNITDNIRETYKLFTD